MHADVGGLFIKGTSTNSDNANPEEIPVYADGGLSWPWAYLELVKGHGGTNERRS